MSLVTGFVPSYELDSGIGRKIAKLKGLREGWHYPTFLLYYIRNPGPLLLFDEIIVDEGAATKAIEYASRLRRKSEDYEGRVIDALRPTESEVQTLRQLLESNLFRKEKVVEMISDEDFERIKAGYNRDAGVGKSSFPIELRNAVAIMENAYGSGYALPDPRLFEAMNINVTWVLLEKLSAIPLDDILRSPLYEYKAIQTASFRISITKTAYDIITQARQILYLPTEPVVDVDTFLTLHNDRRVRKFREKVYSLSQLNVTPREISREVFEANLELQKLEMDSYNIVIALLGIVQTLTSMLQGNFATGLIGTASALMAIGKEIRKAMLTERYGWLDIVRGLCEI
jgi:hypothetical protein